MFNLILQYCGEEDINFLSKTDKSTPLLTVVRRHMDDFLEALLATKKHLRAGVAVERVRTTNDHSSYSNDTLPSTFCAGMEITRHCKHSWTVELLQT